MIVDSRTLKGVNKIHGDIAIVGGGAAGITLALELSNVFKNVLVLESGGLEFEQESQDLYIGKNLGHKTAELDSSRLRYFGGTTNHWNGRCSPLDPVDFEPISGRPFTGWPFGFDELRPHYSTAYDYCEIGSFQHQPTVARDATPVFRRMIESQDFDVSEFRYSPPTRFGERYRARLASSERIKVYLHANVSAIKTHESGNAVTSLRAKVLDGSEFDVSAAAFILCCGGLENPRILLNCNDHFRNGIGNEHDLVGRFFMDHLHVFDTRIFPRNDDINYAALDYRRENGTRIAPCLFTAPETIRQTGRRGCSIVFQPAYDVPEDVQQANSSPAFAAFQALTRNARLGNLPRNLGKQECTALEGIGDIATVLSNRLKQQILGRSDVKYIDLHIEAEQSPNPDSRVTLTDELDPLGMRRIALDWRIAPDDRQSVYETLMSLARGVGAASFGRLVMSMQNDNDTSMIGTSFHHMGTTRMHDDPKRGVVDRNCRVHGIENLYLAGSSVFPTAGRVNPTLTIVALAVRLAAYLKMQVRV